MKTLCVEGWRQIHHSYAMVNQWQLLALLKRPDIALRVKDLPFYDELWQPCVGLFDAEDENRLNAIPARAENEAVDATYRIAYPYDFSSAGEGRTVVFATSEYQRLGERSFLAPFDVDALARSDSFRLITPSLWSRQGFLSLGLREDQVCVVPHGVARHIFRPSASSRKALRERMNLTGFVFGNASAMTDNKGIDLLLRAFAAVSEKHPETRLLMKGSDRLYTSKEYLSKTLSDLPAAARHRVAERLLYDGKTLSTAHMADFYRTVDAYVSPYRAEGFNLPVLEAVASGTPVISTKGGPTDEFLEEEFALFIDSRPAPFNRGGIWLQPDLDHLISLMLSVIDAQAWRTEAATTGAAHAATNYDWDVVAGRLIDAIFE
ncbi:MAG: glycosyltransferase [Pseudolabrys sp.]